MTPTEQTAAVEQAAEYLRTAKYAVALTGAGISTPSGIPDFRSQNNGLWKQNDPMQVASLTAFRTRPQRFFDWLRPLARTMQQAAPNAGHLALAQLEQSGHLKAVITQNIDGLHQKAGSQQVIEIHGSMRTYSCRRCRQHFASDQFYTQYVELGLLPTCPHCAQIVKPDIVLFEEALPADAWENANAHCSQADLILVVGSSLEVYPAAQLPQIAIENGGRLIILTLSATPLDAWADICLPYDIAEVLPQIAARMP